MSSTHGQPIVGGVAASLVESQQVFEPFPEASAPSVDLKLSVQRWQSLVKLCLRWAFRRRLGGLLLNEAKTVSALNWDRPYKLKRDSSGLARKRVTGLHESQCKRRSKQITRSCLRSDIVRQIVANLICWLFWSLRSAWRSPKTTSIAISFSAYLLSLSNNARNSTSRWPQLT